MAREKQLYAEYDNSDTQSTSIYLHAYIKIGTIPLVDYAVLNQGVLNPGHKPSRPCLVLTNLRTLSSINDQKVSTYMETVHEEVTHLLEEYAHTQKH